MQRGAIDFGMLQYIYYDNIDFGATWRDRVRAAVDRRYRYPMFSAAYRIIIAARPMFKKYCCASDV